MLTPASQAKKLMPSFSQQAADVVLGVVTSNLLLSLAYATNHEASSKREGKQKENR
jgi:hypothetical protein